MKIYRLPVTAVSRRLQEESFGKVRAAEGEWFSYESLMKVFLKPVIFYVIICQFRGRKMKQ